MSSIRRAFLALAGAAVLASPTLAAPEKTKGDILAVDLPSGKIVVKHPQNYNMTLTIANDTPVKFTDATEVFLNPTVRDLAPGMYIWFTHENGVVGEIEVRAVSEQQKQARLARGGGAVGAPAGASEVKARIQSIDQRRGEIRADVAGRSQTFRVSDTGMVSRYRTGDMVVLTVAGNDVTNIKGADQSGRITRIDRNRSQVSIDVNGREETYTLSNRNLLGKFREGDNVRFEFEDRANGTKVITSIS